MEYFIYLCFILGACYLLNKYDFFKTKTEPKDDVPIDEEPLSSCINYVQRTVKHERYGTVLNKMEKELKDISYKIQNLKYKFEVNRLLSLIDAESMEKEWAKSIFDTCSEKLNQKQDHSWDKGLDFEFYNSIDADQDLRDFLHFKCNACNLQLKWNDTELVLWDENDAKIRSKFYSGLDPNIPSCKEHIMNQALE